MRLNRNIPATATIRLVGVTNGVGHGYYDQSDQPIYNGDSSYYPVTYSVSPGSGVLYVKEGTRTTPSPGQTLNTSSGAQVFLRMTSTTNKVTATVDTATGSSEGVYIYGRPQIDADETVAGMHAPGTLLTGTTALTADITDSADTAAGVVGVPIKFDVTQIQGPSGGIIVPSECGNWNYC